MWVQHVCLCVHAHRLGCVRVHVCACVCACVCVLTRTIGEAVLQRTDVDSCSQVGGGV